MEHLTLKKTIRLNAKTGAKIIGLLLWIGAFVAQASVLSLSKDNTNKETASFKKTADVASETAVKGDDKVEVAPVPVKILYVSENQPVQIVDSKGRLIQVIYLRKNKMTEGSARKVN